MALSEVLNATVRLEITPVEHLAARIDWWRSQWLQPQPNRVETATPVAIETTPGASMVIESGAPADVVAANAVVRIWNTALTA